MTAAPHYRLSIIPGWIVTDARLKGKDLQVLCLLGRHTSNKDGWCRRSQVKMAGELTCSRSTIQASLDRLVDMGVIEKRIVTSPDGRDSAHRYRVIYDREPESFANSAWDDEDGEENDPTGTRDSATPPAGISAGGADSGQAPPAGSGPAPINYSNLTTPPNPEERERERDGEEEESPKALEKRLRKWWAGWPTYTSDSEANVRREWLGLTSAQRKACEERTPDYIAAVKASARTIFKAGATYLAERAWERLPTEAPADAGRAAYAAPFTKPWCGLRLAEQLQPMAPLPLMSRLSQMVADQVDEGGSPTKAALQELASHRLRHGWRRVYEMYENARAGRGTKISPAIVAKADDFRSVKIDSPLGDAWRRMHERRGWAWPEFKLEYLCFPPSEIVSGEWVELDDAVEQALARFAAKLGMERDNDHAA
ncbi:hypothetical protein SAMN05216228_100231 [Rhizobium tibeticum]|uniref:Helix-turn-helix domain-containing protein n=1 Tax=Rhizobium tibeticum TaxID=501024 RepID=A0A1H8DGX0_9HYPH|nr:helix-turn-helix domain-containing protein [Rhizobium tibeticum]SEH51544.1 hypothetical protein RTCCBAU85039_0852 [Rhizobium tibeticum]SEN05758.1 hypothetical protein SAMN05216228_100231 [Rhizobium tibeticum]